MVCNPAGWHNRATVSRNRLKPIQEESMYVQPSAPRSIGGVLDDAFRLYTASLPKIWPLAVAAAVVLVIPNIFLGLATLKSAALGPQAALGMMKSPGLWLTYLLLIMLYLVLYTA